MTISVFWTAVRKGFLARSERKRLDARTSSEAGTLGAQPRFRLGQGGTMAKKQLLEDIKAEPTRFFRAPSDVLRDRRFSDQERLDILTAWEAVVRTGEGDADHQARLDAIAAARMEVESKLAAINMNGTAVH